LIKSISDSVGKQIGQPHGDFDLLLLFRVNLSLICQCLTSEWGYPCNSTESSCRERAILDWEMRLGRI